MLKKNSHNVENIPNISGNADYYEFGWSVAIDGNYAIVGGEGDIFEIDEVKGYARIYEYGNEKWSEVTKLMPSDGKKGDNFGCAVDICGDYAVVGAEGDNSCFNRVYVFKRNSDGWYQQATLASSDIEESEEAWFGTEVLIKEDLIFVGAPGKNHHDGAVYVFKRDGENWIEQGKIYKSGAFGESISYDGNYLIVGASWDDYFKGAAYIFEHNGEEWIQTVKVTPSDGEKFDSFGLSVAIEENIALIGAYGVNNYRGAVYVFQRDGDNWVEQEKITIPGGNENDIFGRSVALDGDTAFIGSSGKETVYRFTKNEDGSWTQQQLLKPKKSLFMDTSMFGDCISLDDDKLVIGTHGDSVHFFSRDDNGDWVIEDSIRSRFTKSITNPIYKKILKIFPLFMELVNKILLN